MELFALMLICIRQTLLTLYITLYLIMAQPSTVNMKRLPSSSNACNISICLKIYHRSNYLLIKHHVLLITILILMGYTYEIIRTTVRDKLLSLTSILNQMYHSKPSEKPAVKILNGENRTFCKAFLGYLNIIKSLNYLTIWCFNILNTVFQNFRLIHRKLNKFSLISKLVRKTCELSKMRKCSRFSRAPSKSPMRMLQIYIRFGQKCVFYSNISAFLRKTSGRTKKFLTSKAGKNYAGIGYQVFLCLIPSFHAKISSLVTENLKPHFFGASVSLQKAARQFNTHNVK